MKITDISLKRRVAVMVLSVAAVVMGFFSLTRLDVDYLPEITYPMVKIHIYWSGATPDEIETNIAEPIERAMATVDNLDYLDASCIEGMYTLLVNFRYGVNVDTAYQDVLAIMGRVNRKLPDDMDPPVIIKADPSQLPVMEVTVASDQRSLVWLREWVDNWLVDRLSGVPGTAGAEVVGGLEREIRVHLDPARLTAYGLSPDQVATTLRDENRQIFAGRITVENREIIARTMGEFENLDEIRDTAVAQGDHGNLVYVRDVATVEDSHEELRVNTRFNRRPCVKVNVLKQAEANTVQVAQAVKDRLEALRSEIPEDIEFGVVENQGDYVMGAILSVRDSAILAALLVILVTYLFLGHWRQVVVMVVVLPVTILSNFLLMKLAGFSLNLFSLGGLVVALGVVLDGSIIVLENITRLKHEEDLAGRKHSGKVIVRAVAEVGPALIASSVTFLAIFLPFLFIPGLASLLFKELVLVIAGVVIISLLVAVTLTPLLSDLLLEKPGGGEKSGWLASRFDRGVERITAEYGKGLAQVLRFRWLALLLFLASGVAAFLMLSSVGSEFLPKVDDGRVKVKLKMPAGTSVAETDRILANVEKQLTGLPEVQSLFTMAGGRVWGLVTYEIAQEGEVNIQLVPKPDRDISTEEFIGKIQPLVKKAMTPGAKLPVMQMKTKGIRQIGLQDVELKIQGDDTDHIYSFAKQAAAALNEADGFSGVNISMDMTKPEYRIYIDRARAAAMGIPVGKVAATLRGLIGGTVSTDYRDGSEYYDIRVMVPELKLASKEDLENLILDSRGGRPVFVRDIAEVRRAVGPVEITRENQIKQVIVRSDASAISSGEAARRAVDVVSRLTRPSGVSVVPGGQAQMMEENRKTMGMIFGFALFLAFVALAIQFESFRLPLIILLSVPFCLVGIVYALAIAGVPIGATVAIGVFVIIAAAVNDGVLLLGFAEELRTTQQHSPVDAVLTAAQIRLRPRLMTTLSTIAGLIPLALNLGEGGDLLKPMAVAGIGGLLMEIAVALFLMPILYVFFSKCRRNNEHHI
ncbi:efflux RND transporter permease subunit [Pontiellaceae bacterium B12219]|nr:efflux RND transporter permease subunit [Pontiellaceae bacterium B12219]